MSNQKIRIKVKIDQTKKNGFFDRYGLRVLKNKI